MADYIRGLGAEKCHLTFFGHFHKKKKKKKDANNNMNH